MNIKVKYFASMREKMGCGEKSITVDQENISVNDLWTQHLSSNPMPTNILIAVNMEYTDASHVVKDSDEVAFFPQVTGG